MSIASLGRLRRWNVPGPRRHAPKEVSAPGSADGAAGASRALRELLALAWPITIAMMGETAMGLVDMKLVGGLGARALGGVGIGATLMFLSYSVTSGVMRGVKIRTTHAIGEADGSAEGRRAALHAGVRFAQVGLVIGAIAGLIIFAIGRDISPALAALRIDPQLITPARDFVAAVTWGAPAACMLSALVQHRQAVGDARSPMLVGIACNIVNAGLAYALIYGAGGLPALGVRGAGYATAMAQSLGFGALFWILMRDMRACTGAALQSWRGAFAGVFELGAPLGAQFGFETLAFATFAAILGGIGAHEMASHQIALQTIRASFLPGVAIAEAASILVGRALGARRLDEADLVTNAALKVAVGFMALCGVVFAVFGASIAGVFTDDVMVRETTTKLLLIAAAFQVLEACNTVVRGALRGAKDVRVQAVIAIASIWLCVPTAALFLGKFYGLGAVGGWLGFLGETTLSASLCWRRWRMGGWRTRYAPGRARGGGEGAGEHQEERRSPCALRHAERGRSDS